MKTLLTVVVVAVVVAGMGADAAVAVENTENVLAARAALLASI